MGKRLWEFELVNGLRLTKSNFENNSYIEFRNGEWFTKEGRPFCPTFSECYEQDWSGYKCNHSYRWTGSVPCTGMYKCRYCGELEADTFNGKKAPDKLYKHIFFRRCYSNTFEKCLVITPEDWLTFCKSQGYLEHEVAKFMVNATVDRTEISDMKFI